MTRPNLTKRPLARAVRTLLAKDPPRAKSLIVTIFGDALLPHGGSIWMGSLVALLEPLGLNERLVRTAVLRLSRDEWLHSESVGRRSYYSLTDVGLRRFDEAHQRIYAADSVPWDGQWSLVLLTQSGVTAEQRERIRRDLGWLGFASVSPGVLIHPNPDRASMVEAIRDDVGAEKVLVLRAASDAMIHAGAGEPDRLRRFVETAWNLESVGQMYRVFLERFRPLVRVLQDEDGRDPEACFMLRTLLIHEFRRVLLKDPDLPPELLPSNWPGSAARQLCRNLYLLAEEPAERHLLEKVETAEGKLPVAAPYYYARFGGLRVEPVREAS